MTILTLRGRCGLSPTGRKRREEEGRGGKGVEGSDE
jgi:hypothetical protein